MVCHKSQITTRVIKGRHPKGEIPFHNVLMDCAKKLSDREMSLVAQCRLFLLKIRHRMRVRIALLKKPIDP